MKIWGARLFFLIIGGLCDGYMDKGCFFIERPDFILYHWLNFMSKILCYSFFVFFLQSQLDILCKANYTNNAKYAMQINRRCKMKTRIKELRKERKLSQEELALAVGTTRQTITSIEVGKYTASLVLAYKIAHYFGLTIEEVFDFSDENEF